MVPSRLRALSLRIWCCRLAPVLFARPPPRPFLGFRAGAPAPEGSSKIRMPARGPLLGADRLTVVSASNVSVGRAAPEIDAHVSARYGRAAINDERAVLDDEDSARQPGHGA